MARRETNNVLQKARRTYAMARLGLSDLSGDDPKRRVPGFWNAVTFGRSVTFVLQNLRTIDEAGFDTWYLPWQEAMRADPLVRYFHKMRSIIEKEGGPEIGNRFKLLSLNTDDLVPLMENPPPGALGFFIGDEFGGSGWEVAMPDGSRERYYVALPDTIPHEWSLTLADPPSAHLGQPVEGDSASHLCALFLDYIGRILDDAEATFGGQPTSDLHERRDMVGSESDAPSSRDLLQR